MMIVSLLRNVTNQLGNFDFLLEILEETTVENFPFTWFQSINQGTDTSLVIINRKVNQISINKVFVPHFFDLKVYLVIWVVSVKPKLSFISKLSIKKKLNLIQVLIVLKEKVNFMAIKLTKILFSFFIG